MVRRFQCGSACWRNIIEVLGGYRPRLMWCMVFLLNLIGQARRIPAEVSDCGVVDRTINTGMR